jgi:hypothetical protein
MHRKIVLTLQQLDLDHFGTFRAKPAAYFAPANAPASRIATGKPTAGHPFA